MSSTLTRPPDHDTRTLPGRSDGADGAAVASFIVGLLGSVVFNIVLGPLALVLGIAALVRGTRRRGRAALGMLLGAADVALLAALITTHQGITWAPGF